MSAIRCFPLFLLVLLSTDFIAFAQKGATAQQSDAAARIADIEKRIEERKAQDSALTLKFSTISADSAAADMKAEKTIATLAGTIKNLADSADSLKKNLAAMQKEIAAFEAALTETATSAKAASLRSHGAVARFDKDIAGAKQSLDAANKGLDLAQRDSAAIGKKVDTEMKSLRDSLGGLDTSIAVLGRQIDSLTEVQKKVRQDSASALKDTDDSLKTAAGALHETRRLVAKNDSTVQASTTQLNAMRKGFDAEFSKSAQGNRERERKTKILDSLSLSLQDRKITLYRFKEKLKLDSVIEAETGLLRDLKKGGAVSDLALEKQQSLENYQTKRANLLREGSLATIAAKYGKSSREESQRQTDAQLSFIEHSLDSVARARETTVRENILLEKEFKETSKSTAKQIDTLSASITRVSNALTNLKARIPKQERDSAEAFNRRAAKAETFRKKLEAAAAGIAGKKAQSETLTSRRLSLDGYGKKREAFHAKEIERVHAVVGKALAIQRRAQSAYDSLAALQQKTRSDSAAALTSVNEKAAQATLVITLKREEITVKDGEYKKLFARLTQAKKDSAAAVQERKQQQVSFQKIRADAQYQLLQGKQTLRELCSERDALKKPVAAK